MADEKKKYSIGGSALMEGIMMIGPKGLGVSFRLPNGTIETDLRQQHMLKDKYKIARIPFIRGTINFIDQMAFTYKILMESAEKTAIDLDEDTEDMSKLDKWLTDHFGPKMMAVIGAIAAVFGFALAFLLFFYLPSLLADGVEFLVKSDITRLKPLLEGIVRAAILVGYMWAVSNMKDIKRMFMYHGAEHKSIFCHEKGLPLTVENIREQKRFHPRCGTSFIFLVIIVSMLISTIIAFLFPALRAQRLLWLAVKLLLLPLYLGIGYEVLQYAGKHDNLFVKITSAPGLWMQRITTKEPTDDIIEVAIAATEACLGIVKEPEITEETTENNDPEEHFPAEESFSTEINAEDDEV
ncbi:MAG: DUF1385 domain-containing protein [Clostridia bacterium]|nr:DUF1385 domain-containing protein [Clostridia bacterium]